MRNTKSKIWLQKEGVVNLKKDLFRLTNKSKIPKKNNAKYYNGVSVTVLKD